MTDASSELKSALEGILTAVNSELKSLANDNDEDDDDNEEEEEDEDVVTQKKDAKQDSSVQEESENKESDISGQRLAIQFQTVSFSFLFV